MDSRVHKLMIKISANERTELNRLMMQKGSSMSDLVREALKEHYQLENFEPSYSQTASKSYESKWRLY